MFNKKFIIVIIVAIIAVGFCEAASYNPETAIKAYYNMDLAELNKLVKADDSDSMIRLVRSCYLLSRGSNVNSAIEELRELYNSKQSSPVVRGNAGLSFARYQQILHQRGRNAPYADEYEDVYLDIIAKYQSKPISCVAAMYLSEKYYIEYAEENISVFDFLEGFINDYDGDLKDLVPVMMVLADYYTHLQENYSKTYLHLKNAYKIGISSDIYRNIILYRLATLADIKLGFYSEALEFYTEYMELYPMSIRTSGINDRLNIIKQEIADE